MTAWKQLELRVCRALGGRRAGPLGASVSDCVNTPFAVEVKRSSRPGPPVLSQWIIQARTNAHRENRPWLVVVAGHNDRRPIVCLDFAVFVHILEQAGWIPAAGEEATAQPPDHATAGAFDAAEAQPTTGPPQTRRKTR